MLIEQINRYRRAMEYLDGCGEMTFEKLQKANELAGGGMSTAQLQTMWGRADSVLPSAGRPGGKEYVRFEFKRTCEEGIADFEGLVGKMGAPEGGPKGERPAAGARAPRPSAPVLDLREDRLALAEPAPPAAARRPVSKRPPRAEEPPGGPGGGAFGLGTEERLGEKPQRTGPSLELRSRPAERAPKPAPRAPRAPQAPSAELPGPGLGELLLETDRPQAKAAPAEAASGPSLEPEEKRPLLSPRSIKLIALAAVLLGALLVWRFVSCDSEPAAKDAAAKGKSTAKAPKKPSGKGEKAADPAAIELARLEALARKGAKEADELIRQCDAFLAAHGDSEYADKAKKLREGAQAALKEKDAEEERRTIEPGLGDSAKPISQRLDEMDAFIKKHAGTNAAKAIEKRREGEIKKREAAAQGAALAQKAAIEKHLKAEAYGAAIAALAGLAEAHEGTKAGAAASAQAQELRAKLAADFKEKKAAIERLVGSAAFAEAIAQLDAPLSRWQSEELKREASSLAASLRERREKIVGAYGGFLADFERLTGGWKFDEARAAATDGAAKSNEALLRQLLQGKAAEAEAMIRAVHRVVAGAKAEQAKAAAGDGKVWLKRSSGMALKASLSNPTNAGFDTDMPDTKGHLAWGDLHTDQLLLFARSAPGQAAAADHTALGLVALRAGSVAAAFAEFREAVKLDPAATEAIQAHLRHHVQGFVLLPACQFPAGARKEPKAVEAFLLGASEVTCAEYAFFATATGAALPPEGKDSRDDHPVANVTWQEADAYARWLDMRLPTDLEWERAVRGTEGRLYPWGDKFEPGRANLARPAAKGPATPAPMLAARRHLFRRDESPFFHLVGNVREWTATAVPGPKGAVIAYQVVGGSVADAEAAAAAHARVQLKPDARDPHTGFRLAWPR